MLLKLLKYDFRSMWKQFSFIWPAALILGFINRFTLPISTSAQSAQLGQAREWVALVSMTVFIGVCLAMVVVTAVYVLTRFYRGLLGDEGYLMHTLPVSTWQLVLSKLVCALVVTVANGVVGLASIFLMIPLGAQDVLDPELWNRILRALAQQPEVLLYMLEYCILFLTMFALMFTMFYLSMAIGHLFARHRVFMSVVAFFVIDIVGNLILSFLDRTGLLFHAGVLEGHLSVWIAVGLLAIPTVLMFLGTSYILKNRLNLE